jgi:hypothetical protein
VAATYSKEIVHFQNFKGFPTVCTYKSAKKLALKIDVYCLKCEEKW